MKLLIIFSFFAASSAFLFPFLGGGLGAGNCGCGGFQQNSYLQQPSYQSAPSYYSVPPPLLPSPPQQYYNPIPRYISSPISPPPPTPILKDGSYLMPTEVELPSSPTVITAPVSKVVVTPSVAAATIVKAVETPAGVDEYQNDEELDKTLADLLE
ncbi:unnamed protein product [Caenorhabditis angaria]|uniref:Uncharacterized protein n=1 Tax=Caenorhabditis angaria TaxID=860376 RepID=A0A9P1IZD8_9PELO|nr:unnamed protein product [Caenorhabditis angaria]